MQRAGSRPCGEAIHGSCVMRGATSVRVRRCRLDGGPSLSRALEVCPSFVPAGRWWFDRTMGSDRGDGSTAYTRVLAGLQPSMTSGAPVGAGAEATRSNDRPSSLKIVLN